MSDLITILVFGLASAAIYAVAASGLVLTYTTSGIFNFAHGAIAMFCAFVYWQLSSPDAWGLPVWLSLVLTLLVFAPLLGVLIDRVLMRGLSEAAPITRLVVPIGLLVALIQVAAVFWPPAEVNAALPPFFSGKTVQIGEVAVSYHQLLVMAVAVVVAIALRILLYNTRSGVAMRAAVDSRELTALNGASPQRASSLAWALGCVLAGVAGILVAPILRLDQVQLTFLVINGYAAAMVGRLRSLPLTAVGALILGISQEVVRRYDTSLPNWINVDTVPVLMLFAVILLIPQDREELFGTKQARLRVPNPTVVGAAVAGLALVAVALALPSLMSGNIFNAVGVGVALAVIALSLVPLTGYAGQINLAPMAFAGVGAVVSLLVAKDGNPIGMAAAVAACAVVGALVALPALRLKGLYLALCTMAFALFCEKAIFNQVDSFKNSPNFARVQLGELGITSDRAYLVFMATILALLGVLLTVLRRGTFGRRLQALKDSPAACATIGLNLTRLKVEVFALSAAIAGLGGVLLAQWRTQAGPSQFALLDGNYPGLPLILMTVVGGIAAIAGALVGGLLLPIFPVIGDTYPVIRNFMNVLPGLVGISLARNPDGAISQVARSVAQIRAGRKEIESTPSGRFATLLLGIPSPAVPEAVPVGGGVTADQREELDRVLGMDWGRCHGST